MPQLLPQTRSPDLYRPQTQKPTPGQKGPSLLSLPLDTPPKPGSLNKVIWSQVSSFKAQSWQVGVHPGEGLAQ